MDTLVIPLAVRLALAVVLVAASPLLIAFLPAFDGTRVFALGLWGLAHPVLYGLGALVFLAIVMLAVRGLIHLWWNRIRPLVSGARETAGDGAASFRSKSVDLLKAIAAHQEHDHQGGQVFVGVAGNNAQRQAGKPVALSDEQRTMHLQVTGATGSGKTQSLLAPLCYQDILAGKGALWMTSKGSEEEIKFFRNACEVAGRSDELLIFSLQGADWSHTYNPLWLEPRSARVGSGGDPLGVAERVFVGAFADNMEEPFYRSAALAFWRGIIPVLHGLIAPSGRSFPFSFEDVLECLQNREALDYCLQRTLAVREARDLTSQLASLGKDAAKTLLGLQVAVQTFASLPHLNSYSPDIVIEDIVQRGQIVYFQLPANLYAGFSAAIGKIVLQELQQAGARRQIDRSRSQRHFPVFIDEFYNFAFPGFIDALNKLRDANFQFTLAHQSFSDLQRVSDEYASGIWDNTRLKAILALHSAEFAEQLAKTLGTHKALKTTTQHVVGSLMLRVNTGQQSLREVDEFNLHPNSLKGLAKRGQAYLVDGNSFVGLNLGCMPRAFFHNQPKVPLAPRQPARAGLALRDRFTGQGVTRRKLGAA